MLAGIVILLVFIIAGIFTGLNVEIPYSYSNYIAVAILACLDSVFGAFTANIEKKFDMKLFLSGFFGNSIIAIFLVYIGQKLNVDIYLAVVIVLTARLLNNFTIIRRNFTNKIDEKAVKRSSEIKVRKNSKKAGRPVAAKSKAKVSEVNNDEDLSIQKEDK